jgi:hypothetical protein
MKLYECEECGEYYYKKAEECPYCDGKEFSEIEGSEREVIFTVLKEIELESGEYQQFDEDTLEEKVDEKLKKSFDWTEFSFALDKAVEKGYFSKITLYISRA